MLALARIVWFIILIVVLFPIGMIYCCFKPRHRSLVNVIGHGIARTGKFLGLEVELRYQGSKDLPEPAVWIANHQSSMDLFTLPFALRDGVVSIGKKSLIWIPFFGLIYWITGNILIDRDKRSRSVQTLKEAAKQIKERNLSVWMFPEGTRSYGRGLLPFKTGAFHLSRQANVPVVPIFCSSTHQQIKLNRWNNGKVIVEVGETIAAQHWDQNEIRQNIKQVHQVMQQRVYELTLEARGQAFDYTEYQASLEQPMQEEQA
ncbi:1-acylglycerol-3-phosphate O-acyltransferase [Alginatibacterium sediminis]|uniref:1-acyl-sn-glycerol-3-phosphate acyltransferase n=1 Tax=Alginatibacterium sediminis TaxID=2164068 RepID=A0A420ECN1_9ALTE|nr:1-acylglycerol-3-phosphate O-acyltransferase [Alginatibacterium sediminis]RKF18457.1 1-acylglycerol-3-phosphate O-acyltransferase [Alginatibacterium sediminis]